MTPGIKLSPVHPFLLEECWDEAEACLAKACEVSGGRTSIDSLRAEVESGHQTLWLLHKGTDGMMAAATTCFTDYPDRRLLTISFFGSHDSNSRPVWYNDRDVVVSTLSRWAKGNGCDGIEIIGRRGWAKALEPLGFKVSSTIMEAEV